MCLCFDRNLSSLLGSLIRALAFRVSIFCKNRYVAATVRVRSVRPFVLKVTANELAYTLKYCYLFLRKGGGVV